MGKDADPEQVRAVLTGTWFRSFEEETGDELVFRPPGYVFAPARAPRPALRLNGDGTAAALRGGATDRPEAGPGPGRWSLDASTLSLQTPDLAGTFTLEQVDPDRLVVRPRPDPGQVYPAGPHSALPDQTGTGRRRRGDAEERA